MKITNDLLDGRIPGIEGGERVDEFVNLYDSGDRGSFTGDLGFLENSFPGVDPPASPAKVRLSVVTLTNTLPRKASTDPTLSPTASRRGGHQPAPMAAGR